MPITADGKFDWMLQDPGPPGAVNGGRNGGLGMVPHSAEGNFPTLSYLHDFLWQRGTAPPGQRASWGATLLKDGRSVQHYSVWAQTWTSGAPHPNNNFFAFECEGKVGQELTPVQTSNIIRIGRDLMALQGWKPRRPANSADKQASLYEHNECTRWGALATACPSGRIPWDIIVPALKGDEPMTAEEKIEFEKLRQTVAKLAVDQHGNNQQQALYMLMVNNKVDDHLAEDK